MNISVQGLSKTFGLSPALHGVSLEIASGELLGLLGPSGSGKTTLLRIMAGLEAPTGGRVLFGNEDTSTMSVQERRVGFVFQSYALFRHMTVAGNVAYGLRLRPAATRPASADIDRRVNELLDLVQLADMGKRYPAQLSGGQRQRVALARALAVEPRVLLLDEPFGALDAQVRKDLRRRLREIHDRTGHTTVFVTHDQDEALELSDRVAVLNRGGVEQVGSPDDIYDRPATPFVYGFIGEANVVDAGVFGGDLRLGDRQIAAMPSAGPFGSAKMFFRPQHARFSDDARALPGIICARRRVGPVCRAEVALVGTDRLIELDAPESAGVQVGGRVGVWIDKFTLFADDLRHDGRMGET